MKINFSKKLFYLLFFILLLLNGCASSLQQSSIIAKVNNSPITAEYFMEELKRFHFQQMKSGQNDAASRDIKNFLDRLIDRKLIIQEAKRANLDKDEKFQEALEKKKEKVCVQRWYKDNIIQLSKKLTQEDIDLYAQAFNQTVPKVSEIQLKQKQKIRKYKEKLLFQALLEQLKKQVSIIVFEEKLDEFINNSPFPSLTVALVNEEPIRGDELYQEIKKALEGRTDQKEEMDIVKKGLKELIDYYIVKQVSITEYSKKPEIQQDLINFKEKRLYRAFLRDILRPKVEVTDDDVEQYYSKNIGLYITGASYYIEEIIVQDQDQANQMYQEILQGADFSLWKKMGKTSDSIEYSKKWISLQEIQPELRTFLSSLDEGQISAPFQFGNEYFLFKVRRKKGGAEIPLEKVKKKVRKKVFAQKFRLLIQQSIAQLREVSEINIYDHALQKVI